MTDRARPDPTTVEVDGRRWPVDAETVRRLILRLGRERQARLRAEAIAEEATRASLIDPLTRLPNRRRLLEHADGLDGPAAAATTVMVVDIDRFKAINDTLGHGAGDDALVEVATRLRTVVRPTDTVVRLGGDEFVCICRDLPDETMALRIAERIRGALAAPFRHPDGPLLSLSASVGVALATDDDPALADLVRDADAAAGAAKAAGGDRVSVFDDEVRRTTRDRNLLERELRVALADGRLEVHYQPVVELGSLRVTGVEALVRWRHDSRGWVPPSAFVPVAEQFGLVRELDRFVLCRTLGDLREHDHLTVAVNVSATELSRVGLHDEIAQVLAEHDFPAERLHLEITESTWLSPSDVVVHNVVSLERLGVHVVIDDFGTGHSALAHLQRLPVRAIKVDRSFVAGVVSTERDAIIVQAIVAMAEALQLDLVAEGVETDEQRRRLLDMGVRSAQGWLFAPALPLDELLVSAASSGRQRAPGG